MDLTLTPSAEKFIRRMIRYALLTAGIILLSLGVGILGYHYLESLSWIDALLMVAASAVIVRPASTDWVEATSVLAAAVAAALVASSVAWAAVASAACWASVAACRVAADSAAPVAVVSAAMVAFPTAAVWLTLAVAVAAWAIAASAPAVWLA